MTEAKKPKGPMRYRYTGFDDAWVRGVEIRHGDIIEVNDGVVTVIEHGVPDDHFSHDKRFEKVK